MTAQLKQIIETVDSALPAYSRWAVRPTDMASAGGANCFGRVATIGSALHARGTPYEALTLLINRSHAFEFKTERSWLGHVALVVNDESGMLVDAPMSTTHIRDLGTITWPGSLSDDGQIEVIDKDKLPKYLAADWDDDPYLSRIYGERQVYEAQPAFTAHPFAQGIELYQSWHPDLNVSPIVRVADYADFYDSLPQLVHTIS